MSRGAARRRAAAVLLVLTVCSLALAACASIQPASNAEIFRRVDDPFRT